MVMHARVVMKSQLPIVGIDKLAIFTIGGFQCKTDKNVPIHFDWDDFYGGFDKDEEDHIIATTELECFNEEIFVEENAKNGITNDMITPELLSNSQLTELYYEAYEDDMEEKFVNMDLVSFDFIDPHKSETFSLSQENIKVFNEKYAAHIIHPISFDIDNKGD